MNSIVFKGVAMHRAFQKILTLEIMDIRIDTNVMVTEKSANIKLSELCTQTFIPKIF